MICFEVTPAQIMFWQSAALRRKAALRRMLMGTGITFAVLAVILIPDFFAKYQQEPLLNQALFVLSLLMISSLLGFAFGFSKVATRERWILNRIQQELTLEKSIISGQPRQEVIDLQHIKRLGLTEETVQATMHDGFTLDLIKFPRRVQDKHFKLALNTFIKEHHLKLEHDE